MRLTLTTALIILLAIFRSEASQAQEFIPTPVEISDEKVSIKGDIYYLHKVLKGQTLYSISKAYGVSLEELHQVNASLSEGLKTGMLLYIPAKQDRQTESVTAATAAQEDTVSVKKDLASASQAHFTQETVSKLK